MVRPMQTSLELIHGMQQLGIRRFIYHPHIIGDMCRNTRRPSRPPWEARAACKSGIDVQLDAAAEI